MPRAPKGYVPADQEDRVAKTEEGETITFGTKDSAAGPHTVTILAKCETNSGRWYCATHRQSFDNQLQKDIHIERDKHRLAWMCFEHGPEVP